jgi:hypothetical protein
MKRKTLVFIFSAKARCRATAHGQAARLDGMERAGRLAWNCCRVGRGAC